MATSTEVDHWLLLTPQQLLSSYNRQRGRPQQYGSLRMRMFVFARDQLLLIGRRDRFDVPTLQFTSRTEDRLLIRDEILFHLVHNEGIPRRITQELQFMEFSQHQPLISTYPLVDEIERTHELSLSVILTTASPLPLLPYLHWVTKDDILSFDITPVRPTMGEHLDCQYIARAFQRVAECRKRELDLTTNTRDIISQNLLAILNTKHLVEKKPTLGNGWIALDDSVPGVWSLGLYPAQDKDEAVQQCSIFEKWNWYRVLGNWGEDGIIWREDVGHWQLLVDEDGRLRAGLRPRERVEWKVVVQKSANSGEDEGTLWWPIVEEGDMPVL